MPARAERIGFALRVLPATLATEPTVVPATFVAPIDAWPTNLLVSRKSLTAILAIFASFAASTARSAPFTAAFASLATPAAILNSLEATFASLLTLPRSSTNSLFSLFILKFISRLNWSSCL